MFDGEEGDCGGDVAVGEVDGLELGDEVVGCYFVVSGWC